MQTGHSRDTEAEDGDGAGHQQRNLGHLRQCMAFEAERQAMRPLERNAADEELVAEALLVGTA